MRRALTIVSGLLGILGLAAMGVATIAGLHVGQTDSPLADGGAVGLVLVFLAGCALKWREHYPG